MKTFNFLYEDINGQLCDWTCQALSRHDAYDLAEKENSEIVDCCVECNEIKWRLSPCRMYAKEGINDR